jgi:TetR/AcrR family transcriptional repressor of nem operon
VCCALAQSRIMPRPKTFDPDHVLDAAIELFRAQGYRGTSFDDLVKATGVARYGLYTTYGDKRDLFLASLKRYPQRMERNVLGRLRESTDGKQALRRHFERLVETVAAGDRRGCLICNTAIEPIMSDRAVAGAVRRGFERMESAYGACIDVAQSKGELDVKIDSGALADYFVSIHRNVVSMARAGYPVARIRRFVAFALDAVIA